MNKQEILQRSRMENQEYGDECQQGLVKGSCMPAFIGLLAVWFFFTTIDFLFLGNILASNVFSLGVNVSLAAQQWYMFFKTKKKLMLFLGIIWVLNSVIALLVVVDKYGPLVGEKIASVL